MARRASQTYAERVEPSTPKTSLERLREAEQTLPGLKEAIEERGYTEEQVAEQIEQRLASSPTRTPVLPSEHPLGSAALLALLGLLGYLGLGYTHHHGAHGWWNAALCTGALLAVLVVQEIRGRRRR
jgi:hypothetical protein